MIRLVLVIGCVALFGVVLAGMRLGWRNQQRRQAALPPLPGVPATLSPPILEPLSGLYVATTYAGSWQARVVHASLGHPADVIVTAHEEGVLADRRGAPQIFISRDALIGAELAPALAGKVVGAGGILAMSWRWDGVEVTTGVRADDKAAAAAWARVLASPAMGGVR